MSSAVAIAVPALAQTTCFCAAVALSWRTAVKIAAASSTVFPPPIASGVSGFSPKSAGRTRRSQVLEIMLVAPVKEISS